jgi:hypothetical protein
MGTVTLARFITYWEDKISRIEQSSLDDAAVKGIEEDFEVNELEIKLTLSEEDLKSGAMLKLSTLKSKLYAALETANSRFNMENPLNAGRVSNFFNGMLEGVHQ